jgi:hypothetical protein
MTPEEVALFVQLFLSLEPELQKGISDLVGIFHKSKNARIAAAEAALAAVQASQGK